MIILFVTLLPPDYHVAYTHYSFFEWGLIIFDVLYDAMAEQEFREANLQVRTGSRAGACAQNLPVLILDILGTNFQRSWLETNVRSTFGNMDTTDCMT